jgi:enoyl-CoA hydratase/carnithine racemase
MSDAPVVRLEKDGDVALIIVNYPPVNALGPGVSDGIIACLNEANADPSVKSMVLMGDGRSFIAGADIRGFGTSRKRPPLGSRTYDMSDRGAVSEGWAARGADRHIAGWWRDPATAAVSWRRDSVADDHVGTPCAGA